MNILDSKEFFLISDYFNVNGYKSFKNLLLKRDYSIIVDIAQEHQDMGCYALDLNIFIDNDHKEIESMKSLIDHILKKVTIPLSIDTRNVELFKIVQGCYSHHFIFNSLSFVDNEKYIEYLLPYLHKQQLIFLPIKEYSFHTNKQRMAIVETLRVKCTKIPIKNIIIDALIYPLKDDFDSANVKESLSFIKMLRSEIPEIGITGGIRNLGFGLPQNIATVIENVFLYYAVSYGMNYPLYNPRKIYKNIDKALWKLGEDLLFNRSDDTLKRCINYFQK